MKLFSLPIVAFLVFGVTSAVFAQTSQPLAIQIPAGFTSMSEYCEYGKRQWEEAARAAEAKGDLTAKRDAEAKAAVYATTAREARTSESLGVPGFKRRAASAVTEHTSSSATGREKWQRLEVEGPPRTLGEHVLSTIERSLPFTAPQFVEEFNRQAAIQKVTMKLQPIEVMTTAGFRMFMQKPVPNVTIGGKMDEKTDHLWNLVVNAQGDGTSVSLGHAVSAVYLTVATLSPELTEAEHLETLKELEVMGAPKRDIHSSIMKGGHNYTLQVNDTTGILLTIDAVPATKTHAKPLKTGS